jgi:hypothetical protein
MDFHVVPAGKQSNNLYDVYLILCVQSWTPDDGRKDRPKHVEWSQNWIKTNQTHIRFKIVKPLSHSTLLYMFRTLLCPSSGAFHHCTCSLWLPCGVVLVASSRLVLLLLRNKRTGLEDATNTTLHGNQRLHVQWWKAPVDGHSSVRNM